MNAVSDEIHETSSDALVHGEERVRHASGVGGARTDNERARSAIGSVETLPARRAVSEDAPTAACAPSIGGPLQSYAILPDNCSRGLRKIV